MPRLPMKVAVMPLDRSCTESRVNQFRADTGKNRWLMKKLEVNRNAALLSIVKTLYSDVINNTPEALTLV